MPVYEYKCEQCGKVFEYQQKITDEPLQFCPIEICESEKQKGKGRVHRLISRGVGLVFKGNGFYITDYARRNASIDSTTPPNGSSAKNGESVSNNVNAEKK